MVEQMTLKEKIGQFFILPIIPECDPKQVWETLRTYRIGGVILTSIHHPKEQICWINTLQKWTNIPLLCMQDAEYGLGMRISGALSFPKNLTLGAISNNALLEEMGESIGEQCKLMGIHLNLAPVVDVSSNPNNPIIGVRSFGEDSRQVAEKGAALIRGMRKAGILTCAKHFPGHGDTETDSHLNLPIITRSRLQLEEVEWPPFKRAISENVSAVMTAHLLVPTIDTYFPTSLSSLTITKLLREEWQFNGLIITDALNMGALSTWYCNEKISTESLKTSNNLLFTHCSRNTMDLLHLMVSVEEHSIETIALEALKAGNDLLLYGHHQIEQVEYIYQTILPLAFSAIEKAILRGEITEEELDRHVIRILSAKERLGLPWQRELPHPSKVMRKLCKYSSSDLPARLFSEAITLWNMSSDTFPIESPQYIRLWEEEEPILDPSCTVILALNHPDQLMSFMEMAKMHSRVILVLFGPPYFLNEIPSGVPVILGYEWCSESERAVWDIITGKAKVCGTLPVTLALHQ